jgi:hypothetical protein
MPSPQVAFVDLEKGNAYAAPRNGMAVACLPACAPHINIVRRGTRLTGPKTVSDLCGSIEYLQIISVEDESDSVEVHHTVHVSMQELRHNL